MKNVNVYNGVLDTKGVVVPIDAVRRRILTGERQLKERTEMLNILAQTDADAYKREKAKLPAVTWSGTFPPNQRSGHAIEEHSGRVVLDVDDTLDMGSVLADFAQNPHVGFAFVSPSGKGVKPVIPISPIPKTNEEHQIAFRAVLEVFEEYVLNDPVELPKQHDANRLCFLAFDPHAIHRPNPVPVRWDPADVPATVTEEKPIDFEVTGELSIYLKEMGIIFDAKGKSKYFPKSICPNPHASNNNAVQFFKNENGSINGFCNGCRAVWYLQDAPSHSPTVSAINPPLDRSLNPSLNERI